MKLNHLNDMTKATITYYGHSCFKIEAQGSSIVFDPYDDGSVPGIRLPRGISADIVSCSHGHGDHNAAHLIATTGLKPNFAVSKMTVPHDHHGGAHRGLSDIVFVQLDGMLLCHLGDLGRLPTEQEYEAIGKADVVMLPCAGYFTIDSREAAELIGHLKHPCLKILMHFREGQRGYDVLETIDEVAADIKGIHRLGESTITVSSGQVPDETLTLEPIQ